MPTSVKICTRSAVSFVEMAPCPSGRSRFKPSSHSLCALALGATKSAVVLPSEASRMIASGLVEAGLVDSRPADAGADVRLRGERTLLSRLPFPLIEGLLEVLSVALDGARTKYPLDRPPPTADELGPFDLCKGVWPDSTSATTFRSTVRSSEVSLPRVRSYTSALGSPTLSREIIHARPNFDSRTRLVRLEEVQIPLVACEPVEAILGG